MNITFSPFAPQCAIKSMPVHAAVQEPRESFIDALCYCEIFKKFHCFEPDPRASKFEEILRESFFAMENLREKYWIWDQFKRVDVEECLTGIGKKISDWVERDFPEEASQIAMPLFDLSPEDQQSERIFAPQLIKRVEELWTKTLEAIGRPLSCVIVDPKFQLQYRDSVTGQMRREAPHRMDCLHYAFYKLREENVKNVLFERESGSILGHSTSRSAQILRALGYKMVSRPKKNDIVLYLDKDMRFVHAAVMVDPDELIVEEKWGLHVQILEAPLPFVSEEYGCYALFVRKIGGVNVEVPWVLDPPGISGCERADESEELELPDLEAEEPIF